MPVPGAGDDSPLDDGLVGRLPTLLLPQPFTAALKHLLARF